MKKEMMKPFFFGIGIGAVVLLIVIFAAGWVMTSGSADTKAKEMAEKAVVDRLAGICVTQFKQDPLKDEKLKELKKKSSWEQADYVKKQGWATMPGEKDADRDVAEECAKQILALKGK